MKLAFLVLCIALLLGCSNEYPHRFKHGDRVKMKLDGQCGMIIGVFTYSAAVEVRIPKRDGGYDIVHASEFELDSCV
jgi:hypothetical protein